MLSEDSRAPPKSVDNQAISHERSRSRPNVRGRERGRSAGSASRQGEFFSRQTASHWLCIVLILLFFKVQYAAC